MFKKILVPFDGFGLSDGILRFIPQWAKEFYSSVILLWVMTPNGSRSSSALTMVELEEAARRLSLEVGDVVPMVTVGSPAATIIRIATEEECDLIAMSSHGRGTIARGLLGSVSDDVVRNSYIPTMVFAPRKADEDWSESAEIDRMIVPLDGSRYAEAAVPYVEEMARRMDRISAPEYGLGSCRSQHPKSLYQDRQQRAFQRFFADIDSVGLFGAYRSNTQQPMMRVMRS